MQLLLWSLSIAVRGKADADEECQRLVCWRGGRWGWSFACALSVLISSAYGEECHAPSPQKRAEVASYVLKRFHVASQADLVLTENAQANDDCFWKLRYETASPKREITLYLSPDGQYVTPTLFDLKVDPLAEERAQAERLRKTLTAGDPPSVGPADAPVTIVEFSDFECPFCKRMADVLEKQVLPAQGKSVRIVFRNFPLPMHPWAKTAAQITECAAMQKPAAFWKLHDYLFANQQTLSKDNIHDQAVAFVESNTDIDKAQFESCVDRDMAAGPVAQDVDMGQKNGVRATPTIFINGTRYEGAKDAAQLSSLIQQAMAENAPTVAAAAATAPAGGQHAQ